MATGRQSVNGSIEPEVPTGISDNAPAPIVARVHHHQPEVEEYGRVRVWWEPTDDRQRSGFAGAWWPAKVLNRQKNKLRVKYDNGEEDDVSCEHVSPLDTLPVPFGEEQEELQAGEFCEVSNGSKTDPCAWLGRVIRMIKSSKSYMVGYPFHDSKPERIEAQRIRRARIMEDGEWRLIKPKQEWEDGDVTSPAELELIHEDELWEYVDEVDAEAGPSGAKRPRPAAGGESDASMGEEGSSSGDDDDGLLEDGKEDGRKKKRRKKLAGKLAQRKLEAGARAGASGGVKSETPPGMLSLYVTIDQTASGNFCFTPVPAGAALPPSALQAYFPFSAVPVLRDAAKAQLLGQAGGGGGGAAAAAVAAAVATRGHELGASTAAAAAHGSENKRREPYKRHKTAWNVFVGRNMKVVCEKHPGRQHGEVIQLLGSMWRELSVDERAVYEAESQKLKAERLKAQGDATALAAEHLEGSRSKTHALGSPHQDARAQPVPASQAARAPGSAAGAAEATAAATAAPKANGSAAPAPAAPAPPAAPVHPRSAQQMYTAEFLKALSSAPGHMNYQAKLRAATSAWMDVDEAVKAKYEERAVADVKRYERDHAAWQKQLAAATAAADSGAAEAKVEAGPSSTPAAAAAAALALSSGPGTVPAPAAPGTAGRAAAAAPAAAAPSPAPAPAPAAPSTAGGSVAGGGGALNLEDVGEVLSKGLDLHQVERQLTALGYSPEVSALLRDVWRKESPRGPEAVQLYKSHLHGRTAPDWEAFLKGIVGAERLAGLKAAR